MLDVAFGSTDRLAFEGLYHRLIAKGYQPNREPWRLAGVASRLYFTDDYWLGIELLHVEPAVRLMMRFVASPQ